MACMICIAWSGLHVALDLTLTGSVGCIDICIWVERSACHLTADVIVSLYQHSP